MIKDILVANEAVKPNTKEMAILHKYFAQCFNKEGQFDIEKFELLIKEEVEITKEGYDLNFLGKSYAKLLASIDTTTVIQPDLEHNNKPENAKSENIYISGDNLDGLKHLLKSYAGKVKCIYIDPPYNTGSDGFVYNDNFNFTVEELCTKLSISEEQAKKILDLTKRGSASHSAWLMFMYPRLQLAKDLLTDDGVIFISIDDNEQANLKLLCDNVFGEENLISQFCWQKKTGASDAIGIATITEYILSYVKNKMLVDSSFTKNEKSFDENRYDCKDEYIEERGSYYLDNLDRGGLNYSDSMNYGITCPDGSIVFPNGRDKYVNDGWIWKWSEKKVKWGIENGFIEFRKSKTKKWAVCYKNYLLVDNEGGLMQRSAAHKNLLLNLLNTKGTSDIKELFEYDVFKNSKPVDLILELLSYVNFKAKDIFLDFFSGSATSAQSVMRYNALSSEYNISYIQIQLQEKCDIKTKAYLIGNYHTIDEIGQERIKRAAKKIKEESPLTTLKLDLGFKHYTLLEPTTNTIDRMEVFNPNLAFADENILTQFGRESVLETWLVKDGYGFGAKVQPMKLDKYTAYACGKHLYFVDIELTEKDVVALIDQYHQDLKFNPENFVIFGYSFTFTETEMLRKNITVLSDSCKNLKPNIDIRY